MSFLAGKKTYIVALLMILVGLVNALTGDTTAWQGIMDNAMILLSGTGFAALRAGVSNG
jgi:hypothetical protein